MNLLHDALRAGHAAAPARPATRRRVLLVGAAGALGAAVLEQLLAGGAFARTCVVVTQALNTTLRGLVTVSDTALSQPADEDTAVIVFDRERHANGREQAFARPQPQELPALAAALRRRGVRSLLVVMPHASASLPEALKHGLANLDEQAVAALGFEHLVFVRSAQAPLAARSRHALQGIADWVLSQLQLMIPQHHRPVRAQKVAQFVAEVAAQLADTPEGTRIVPPELVWRAAQVGDVASFAREWLHGKSLP
jgi:hypothetical protein